MLEMVPGFHTQNLVSEIFRLTDAKVGLEKDFSWLEKYTTSSRGNPRARYFSITYCF
jgi:hypothetical protein